MKKILICFISVIAIIHSLNTVIYNLPTNPTQEKYNKYTNFYMTILFEQNWTLFAPTPI
ncbi:DNA-directed RNA polymerase subunit beta, partial [Staphylococcus succinus]